ncbi:hypothetical protein P7V44_06035 [Providencia sp. CRE-3FA-0001]|uniref:Uncharacterized protein n=4 Tax=Morganellaceae TaxID=1903414 RepID=A0AA42JXT3_9GAMM|nr:MULTISPECIES: hypothetical protein [Providencia]EJD6408470.1 hypothetical protein [Providencia rettgeri]EJD6661395.1 hypothetical protein [Providencia rettgeri]ELR5078417.1 hypothetical protein [Providencia rettgeri]ELR5172802.1 hypothetical protein [Providencia rettgeri]ELR5195677.1 hypothetical protein [Providencia rettgeri]
MVGRAGFKFYEFSLRPEPTTSLPRYELATEYLRGGGLACAAVKMVGRAGFEPATSLPRYGLVTEYLRGGELT